jgi:hypothetical protein
MKKYRTNKQYKRIAENVANGNWTDAAQLCIKHGFYCKDLIDGFNSNQELNLITLEDIAYLIELATQMRHQK